MLVSFAQSWTADNGNGTFTNPLFYDEFSDPDIIRVGDEYFLKCQWQGVAMLHIEGYSWPVEAS